MFVSVKFVPISGSNKLAPYLEAGPDAECNEQNLSGTPLHSGQLQQSDVWW